MAVSKHRPKIPAAIRRAVYVRDGWACQYCGREFQPTDDHTAPYESDWNEKTGIRDNVWLELDHIHPRVHGGQDTLENLRAACSPCNRLKSAHLRAKDWDKRFQVAAELIATDNPSECSAERVIAALLGRPFSMKEVRHSGA